eukprot:9708499-Ditylum_brightwellii.AAC.1
MSHYDSTFGGKKESKSFETIAKDMGLDVKAICFLSDSEEEPVVARETGIVNIVLNVKTGNKPLTGMG